MASIIESGVYSHAIRHVYVAPLGPSVTTNSFAGQVVTGGIALGTTAARGHYQQVQSVTFCTHWNQRTHTQ